jgi:branched-chain amino acid aminotransferase
MAKRGTHTYVEDSRNEFILIYVDGLIVPRKEAKISVFDSGFLLGDGVWEGIRLQNGYLCFEEEHMDRLFQGAEQLEIEIGKSREEMVSLVHETLSANSMHSNVHIRIIVSRGLKCTPYQHPNANVGGPTIVVIPEYKKADLAMVENGIRLCTVKTIRGPQNIQDPRLNTLSKLNCIAACIEADAKGYDEGLMLDMNGHVSTCNSTNLFIVRNGEVWTSTGEFCLPGVTRRNIIKLCKETHIPIFEKDFTIKDVHLADEIFVTGTFAGVIPGVEIDNHIINNGKRGNLTFELYNLYKQKIEKLYG